MHFQFPSPDKKWNALQLLLFISICCGSLNSFAQRPNIIYIMADDMGYADLSSYGRKDYQTPNLDKLASEGMRFSNAYTAAPVCTPTRAAFMTGRYPARTPVGLREPLEWSSRDSSIGLTQQYPSIAKRLHDAGYETNLVGKWHLGFTSEFGPLKNGFDYFFGFKGGATDYVSHTGPRGAGKDLYENDEQVSVDGYMTDLLRDKAIEVITKPHQKPFFLSVMFSAPHWPWQAPGDKPYPDTMSWITGGSPQTYAAIMKSMDDAVGAILTALNKTGGAKNTIVIFTSDNGGERFSDMGINRGKKMQLWEGGIKVPAFVRWPGKIKANSFSSQPVITMDWTATILSLARAKFNRTDSLDGMDLTPVLTGKIKEMERTFYWRISQRNQHKAMRSGKWKYLQDEKNAEYLFDLTVDPAEETNLKDSQAAIFKQLKEKYSAWEAHVLTPVPLVR